MSGAPIVTGYCRVVSVRLAASPLVLLAAIAQVDEGETQIINIRETDGRLGPLVFVLVALGCISLASTAIFWWLTRPRRMHADLASPIGSQRDEHQPQGET